MIGRIQINQTWAEIGVSRNPGELKIKQAPAEFMVKQGQSEVSLLRLHDAHVNVDCSETRSDLNLKSPIRLSRDRSAYAVGQSSAGISRIARDGDLMMNQPDVIPMLTKQIWTEPGFNLGLVPTSPPKIEVQGQPWPDIDAKVAAPEVDSNPRPPQVEISRTAVQAYLKQKHGIEINYVPGKEAWV